MGRGLRHELMAAGRWQLFGFFLGYFCLIALMMVMWRFRAPLSGIFGETTDWIFVIGMFAALLIPQVAVPAVALRNARVHCPACGRSLFGVRSMWRLNREGQCQYCHQHVRCEPATGMENAYHLLFVVGGLVVCTGVSWLSLHYIGQ